MKFLDKNFTVPNKSADITVNPAQIYRIFLLPKTFLVVLQKNTHTKIEKVWIEGIKGE